MRTQRIRFLYILIKRKNKKRYYGVSKYCEKSVFLQHVQQVGTIL